MIKDLLEAWSDMINDILLLKHVNGFVECNISPRILAVDSYQSLSDQLSKQGLGLIFQNN